MQPCSQDFFQSRPHNCMESKFINGVEFRQSPTWPTVYAAACGLIQDPSGKIDCGSLMKTGYYRIQWREAVGEGQKMAYAHRVVIDAWLSPAKGKQVDHISGIRTDNSLKNLRYVSNRENSHNQKIHRTNASTSHYLGVCKSTRDKHWCASIYINGKGKYLGIFKEEKDAAKAYDAALLQYDLAAVNFPVN